MRALKSFANGIMLLLLFFVTLGIFYTSSIGSILLSFTTLFLAMAFSFGTIALHAVMSFIFLFIRHPYDIGDRVIIQGFISYGAYVQHMGLFTTTFEVGLVHCHFI